MHIIYFVSAMNELLFECYSAPSVAYGIDAMFSLYKNKSEKVASNACSGIIVSMGFHTVHIIPILDGKISTKGVRRINIGGFYLTNYALKAMQLKYPSHVANMTVGRAEEILQYHCRVVTDYNHEIAKWSDTEFYNRNVKRLQLPFNLVPRTPVTDPEVVKQRRQELAKRLVEMNAKKREEKLNEDKATLRTLQTCLTLYEQGYEDKVKRMIARLTDSNTPGNSNDDNLSVKSSDDIKKMIDKTKSRIEKSILVLERKKNSETNKDNIVNDKNEQPEMKKRREDMDEVEKKELDATINDVKLKRQELLDKRAARQHRKQQLAKRRTAASQERMRIITQLAKKSSKKDSDKDNFGMEDSDWDVYKQINKDIGDSGTQINLDFIPKNSFRSFSLLQQYLTDSNCIVTDSEEEQNLLNEYDQVLKEADPNDEGDGTCGGNEISRDSPEWYQLHLATEQIRISEILFQPSIIGHEQAGISETIEFILKKFSASEQSKLVSDVFLTGSLSCLPGIKSRLEKDLKEMRPFKSSFNVRTAKFPSADAWNGAKKFANTSPSSNFISRQEYEEMGSEYLSVHHCSNMYVPSPEQVEETLE